jgi:hypothetical protein
LDQSLKKCLNNKQYKSKLEINNEEELKTMAKKKAPATGAEKVLQEQFEKETGKKAIHCGNMTKAYKEWKASQ